MIKIPEIIEAVYENGIFKPIKKSINLKENVKVLVILPKKKSKEEIIKELKKLKKVNFSPKKLDEEFI